MSVVSSRYWNMLLTTINAGSCCESCILNTAHNNKYSIISIVSYCECCMLKDVLLITSTASYCDKLLAAKGSVFCCECWTLKRDVMQSVQYIQHGVASGESGKNISLTTIFFSVKFAGNRFWSHSHNMRKPTYSTDNHKNITRIFDWEGAWIASHNMINWSYYIENGSELVLTIWWTRHVVLRMDLNWFSWYAETRLLYWKVMKKWL